MISKYILLFTLITGQTAGGKAPAKAAPPAKAAAPPTAAPVAAPQNVTTAEPVERGYLELGQKIMSKGLGKMASSTGYFYNMLQKGYEKVSNMDLKGMAVGAVVGVADKLDQYVGKGGDGEEGGEATNGATGEVEIQN